MTPPPRQALATRLMRQAVLVTLSVGLVLAGIQFYTGFQTELARLNDRLNQLLSGAEPAARRALLTLDTQLAKEVIDGLRAYPFVVQAALTDETGDNLARFDRLLINSPTRWITAALTRPLDTRTVRLYASPYEFDRFGTLSLTLDRHLALQPFYEHLSSRLLGVLLSAALLALILSWVFYRSVTRPLRSVSEQLGQADPHHPDRLRLDMPPGQAHNEIGRIVSACNQLLDMLDRRYQEQRNWAQRLETSEKHLNRILDHVPQIIYAKDTHDRLIFANTATARFYGQQAAVLNGQPHLQLHAACNEDESRRMAREDRTVLDDGHPLFITEHQLTDSAGQTHILQTSKMRLDWFGEPALLVVSVDISEQVNARRQIARLSFYDSVTNLANRTLFMDHVRQAIQNLRREGRWGGLAIMDLDDFKTLNDIHGHGFGDTVIRHVAQHLALHVPDGTLIGRLGGDEFGLLLPATRDTAGEAADDHRNTLNNLLNTLAEPVLLGGQTLRLHATAGLVLFPDPQGCDADTLLRYADTALFHAKQALRGQVCLFQPRMAHEVSFRVGMEQAVRRALTHKEFVCFFQPKVSIPDGRIIGAEMLARWQDPDKGLIPPDTFIPVLEATGLIEDMSYQLLDQALAQLASWKREGLWPAQGRLAINISPRQFGSPDFAENILNRLAQHRLSGDDLELEVTESILIRDMRETVDTMNVLRAQGIRFAIDDFGTGYSSLAYLKRLPVRMLKIDRSFVRDMEHDPNDAAIVATIIAMADHLNMEVVAEGVETREQLDLLRQQKCTAYQGYLFSAPVDAPHMTHLLQDIAQLPPSAESS